MHIIELLTPAYEAAWLPWAVQYFFLIGIAATAALLAAGCAFLGRAGGQAGKLLPAAVTVLLASAIAAPVALLADLHQPGRFWHFYAHFTPWSWMSLGAFFLPVFMGLVVMFCAAWWLGFTRWLKILAVPLALSALSILVYTGAEVMAVRSRPLWNTIFLPLNFALTGGLATVGAMLLVGRWLPGGMAALPVLLLRRVGRGVAILLVLCAAAWMAGGLLGRQPSFAAVLRLASLFPVWRLGLIWSIVAGVAVIALLWMPASALAGKPGSLVAALAMLASAWMFRWIIFMAVQDVPKYGAGLYLYHMPLGSEGVLGMAGVFGLCVALLAVVTYLLERFPSPRAVSALNDKVM